MAGGAKRYLAMVKDLVPERAQPNVLALLNDYVLLSELDQAETQVPITRTMTSYSATASAASKPEVAACDASAAACTITLPSASGRSGYIYTVKKIDSSANVVTVAGDGTETIDGASTQSLTSQWDKITVVSDGTNWLQI